MLLYRLGIRLYYLAIRLAAVNNAKARKWLDGRRNGLERISQWRKSNEGKLLVVHASSLGEYEQGRELIQWWRQKHPDWKVVVTFFSPSGYDHFKLGEADAHFYLPIDTKRNVRAFLDAIEPSLFVFVRYDFWLELIDGLKQRSIPSAVVSAFFRNDMWFMKHWASWALRRIGQLDAILTQNEESVRVLKAHGIVHARCTGDGRIDRVAQLADSLTELPWLEQFKSDRFLIIAGSPWEPDEDRLIPLIDHQVDTAFLIAPHEVGKVHVDRLMKRLSGFKTARWTELKKGQDLSIYQVLVLDTIGLLSSCYRYGDLAFIGGGYTTGIHSIQEPAAHSCPVLFGPKHNRFPEANTLIERGGAWEIETPEELQQKVGWLRSNNEQRQKATQICRAFIEENRGASQRIGQALEEFIR